MDNQRQWQKYDVFKLIIAVFLVALLLLLFFDPGPGSKSTIADPAELFVEFTATATPFAPATATPSMTASEITPAATFTATPTSTATPTATGTSAPTATVTETVTETPTPTTGNPATQTPTATATADICSLAIDSRLTIGQTVLVRTNLNLRTAPGLDQEIIQVHITGLRLEVVGGPVCLPHLDGAYRWWQVQRPDGVIGWSAEGSLNRFFYFLEPVN